MTLDRSHRPDLIGARRGKKKVAASDTRMFDYVAHRGTGTCTQVQLLVGHWRHRRL